MTNHFPAEIGTPNDYDRHGNDPVRKDDFRPQCGAITFQKRRKKSPQRRSFSPRMYRETL